MYLFLSIFAAAIGAGVAVLLLIGLLFYRKHWLKKLRDKLALDRSARELQRGPAAAEAKA